MLHRHRSDSPPRCATPKPLAHLFTEKNAFSLKKERGTPRDVPPPRPPAKSAPPVSRIFPHRATILNQQAHVISFTEKEDLPSLFEVSSYMYNASSKELYFDQCFELCCRLGAGSFGEVFKVRSREDGHVYAVKRSVERFRGGSDRKRKLEEVRKHVDVGTHVNCVQFYRAWEERGHLYILTELCHSSLYNYSEVNHDIPESTVWHFLIDLLLALKHLHGNNLVHMDIKPANIFIGEDGTCKLGDFGLMLELNKMVDLSEAQEGDPMYIAPELMRGNFGKSADIFSLGITILELACDLDLPKGGQPWHQLREGLIPSSCLEGLSSSLSSVIIKMMNPDPVKRITVDQLLSLPQIIRVSRCRFRQQCYKRFISYLYLLYTFTLLLLHTVYHYTLQAPYYYCNYSNKHNNTPGPSNICQQKQKQHPTLKRHPSEWDRSFSDDELLNDVNILNNSLASPLFNDSSSDDETELHYHGKTPSPTPITTPSANPYNHNNNKTTTTPSDEIQLVPCSTPHYLDDSSNKHSPVNLVFTPSTGSSSSRLSSLTDPCDPDDHMITLKPGIGPKNLLSIFEDAASRHSDSE